MELLVDAARDQGITVVLVTHDPRVALRRPRPHGARRQGHVVVTRPGFLVIRLGLRLTLNGGREAVVRVAVTAAAVALGVALLLATLAGINALPAKTPRTASAPLACTRAKVPSRSAVARMMRA
jgi:hypothetical protein